MSIRTLVVLFALLLLTSSHSAPAATAESSQPPPLPPEGSTAPSSPAGTNPAWLGKAQKQIAAAEYEVTWQAQTTLKHVPAAWHAPNRAHGFRTYFTDEGIRVVPRTKETASWEWGLTLIGLGRGGKVTASDKATLSPDKNRIEYIRSGLTEWYVNDTKGLEQGFTIEAPPESDASRNGSVSSEPAYVALRLDGTRGSRRASLRTRRSPSMPSHSARTGTTTRSSTSWTRIRPRS